MQQVIVLGDLNETLTQLDRQPHSAPRAAAAAAASPVLTLEMEGFTDVFRQLHSDAALAPGFTHFIDGARPSRSRIDYIWARDVAMASFFDVKWTTHCVPSPITVCCGLKFRSKNHLQQRAPRRCLNFGCRISVQPMTNGKTNSHNALIITSLSGTKSSMIYLWVIRLTHCNAWR
jgi:hypothetical protein